MFVVANRVPVSPGYEEMFEERFRKRAGEVDKQTGFVKMHVMKPASENTPYVVLTYWADRQAFENWVNSEDFKLAHQNPMPKEAYQGSGGGMEQFDVVISSD